MEAVIAFSLWGNDPKYAVGAQRNAELAGQLLPDWTCRFYVGACVAGTTVEALRARRNVEVVAMDEPGDWTGMFWRFWPCSDPDVDVMVSRDADSRLSAREVAAVQEWLDRPQPFHIMRDHPLHSVPILGGMWGCKRGCLPQMAELCRKFVKANRYQIDQKFLSRNIYPLVRDRALVHDEFYELRPFPTPRAGSEFVGEVFDEHDRPNQEHRELLQRYLQTPWELPPLVRRHWMTSWMPRDRRRAPGSGHAPAPAKMPQSLSSDRIARRTIATAQTRGAVTIRSVAGRPRVALLVSSTSRNSGYRSAADFLLLQGRLRSFLENASGQAGICLLLAYDRGDAWFESHHRELEQLCCRELRAFPSVIAEQPLEIHCVPNPATSNPVYAWNYLFDRAAERGIEYGLQLGDDVVCQSPDWDASLIGALQQSEDWGVAGGWSGNDDIITQAFVRIANHRQLFGTLYPPTLRNWGSDTWLDHTYRSLPGLRHWMPDDIRLANTVVANSRKHDHLRYVIAEDWQPKLQYELCRSRQRLTRHFLDACAVPVRSVCTTAARRDIPALFRFLYSLRLFEPEIPVVVRTNARDEEYLAKWRHSTCDSAVRVVAGGNCDRRFQSLPLAGAFPQAAASLTAALERYPNALHLPPHAIVTAQLGPMPRWGTIGLLPRFLKRRHERGQHYDAHHAYAAQTAEDAGPDGEIVFDLTEGYGLSAERLRLGHQGIGALQHGDRLRLNGITVHTISAPLKTSLDPKTRRVIRLCWHHLAECRDERLRRLAQLRRRSEVRKLAARTTWRE